MRLFHTILIAIPLVFSSSFSVYSHSTSTGWQYDYECCSDEDCQKMTMEEVKQYITLNPDGSVAIESWNITVPAENVRESKDGNWHWCVQTSVHGIHVPCIYKPLDLAMRITYNEIEREG